MPRSQEREELYIQLSFAVMEWSDRFRPASMLRAWSHLEGVSASMGDDATGEMRDSYCRDVHPLLRRLADAMPFEIEAGVREVLAIEKDGHAGEGYLKVRNVEGKRDHVTTFGLKPNQSFWLDAWCQCREDSLVEDTPWDRSREERRTVMDRGEVELIDRGANRIMDIVNLAGGRTRYTCEGHPLGAYVVFRADDEGRLPEAFRSIGWKTGRFRAGIEGAPRRSVFSAFMPEAKDVHERDRMWRNACHELERLLELSLDDQPTMGI